MAIDAQVLGQQMLSAALPILKASAPNVEPLATLEISKLAYTIAATAHQVGAGQLTQQEAAVLLDVQKNASRSVLLGFEGLSLLKAEQAINSAYGVARTALSGAGIVGIVGPWPP
jgi:hypothetical protein